MTWRTRNALATGAARFLAAGLVAISCWACGGPPALAPGEAVEGRLEPESTIAHRVDLAQASYVRIRVRPTADAPPGAEVAVRVLAPDGRPLVAAEPVRDEYGGLVAWVGEKPGRYRIEVSNPSPATVVPVRLALEEVRSAGATDRDRALAEQAGATAARHAASGAMEPALTALESALAHWRRTGETGSVVEILLDLASLEAAAEPAAALARYDEAIGLSAEEALVVWQIDALNARANLLLNRTRDCEGARAGYLQARRLAGAEPGLPRAAILDFNLAVLEKRCAPDRAEEAFREAIATARAVGDPATEAVAHRELSILARQARDPEAAREHLEIAWRLAEESGDREAQADVSHALGNLHRRQGRLAEALRSFRRCLELNEALGKQEKVVEVLLSLGGLSLDLRRPEEAWVYDERALALAEALGDAARRSEALRELGAVRFQEGDTEAAIDLYRRALAAAEQLEPSSGARRIATARARLGAALLAGGRPAEAVVELRRALEEQPAEPSRPDEAIVRRWLGAALGDLGETEPALEQLESALEIQRRHGEPLGTVWTLYRLARVQARVDPARARETIAEAIAVGQRLRRDLSVDTLRTGFAQRSRPLYELYVNLLVTAGDHRAAFRASEDGRARSLLDLMSEARVDPAVDAPPDLLDEAERLDHRIAWLHNELRDALEAGSDTERIDALRRELEHTERAWWQVESALREQSTRYEQLRAPAIRDAAEVQADLTPGRSLVEYWLGEDNAYAFVLTRDRFELVELPPSVEIERLVTAFRDSVLSLEPPARFGERAYRLYRAVVAPVLEAAGPVEELVVVPDGLLHLLPFEALVTEPPAAGARFSDLAYLLRRASISYGPSATVLATLEPTAGTADGESAVRFLAYADPLYERPLALECPGGPGTAEASAAAGATVLRARDLAELRGSRREVARIAARYGDRALVHQGDEATEERVKEGSDLARAERVHFAVHGVVCESYPERSGLVLALREGAEEDGVLQTREIFGLQLSADLVVLSACDTALGRLVSGEGVVGLARAFFYAGAPSLVVSLWQVSDRSTADLMDSFYRHLDAGDDKAAALRSARLELIGAGGRSAAPFYWAPFILIGDREVRPAVGTP